EDGDRNKQVNLKPIQHDVPPLIRLSAWLSAGDFLDKRADAKAVSGQSRSPVMDLAQEFLSGGVNNSDGAKIDDRFLSRRVILDGRPHSSELIDAVSRELSFDIQRRCFGLIFNTDSHHCFAYLGLSVCRTAADSGFRTIKDLRRMGLGHLPDVRQP